MKPTVKGAMENLIKEAREKIPFNTTLNSDCEGRCEECPYKNMEWLDIDLLNWEDRLKRGEAPTLLELEIAAGKCKYVYDILVEKGFIKKPTGG